MARSCAPPAPAPEPLLLTSAAVAALLGSTPVALRTMVSRGFFPRGARIDGLGQRWTRASVDAWIAQKCGG